ncbi:Bacteriophage CI repressor helix-turn-helix domain [Serratia marcescens]|uniref:phage repressor protein CI n=1 Tax=Serratia marcescens TaxID=615 RepID=UPI0009A4DED0|nr:phage repressor protein CI [Serratia marcescens]OPK00329.1 phage repressor protein [Serratia marcescens]CAB5630439.1 Bacteriophage CI repressor helix-turn-helix domain [Serratia marcescens]CAB5638139.1 Bacteriophage CI repressor helix-turn-helix domain [Serratia marcescens]
MDFKNGGREVIERLIEAYGFTTRQALCDHLGVSKSTLATRYMRDLFPAEWVIQCALETGVSLSWIAFKTGPMYDDKKNDVISIPRLKILEGKAYDSNFYLFDKALLPEKLKEPLCIVDGDVIYIAERAFDEINDGKWLIEIEGTVSIRDIIRVPRGKIRIFDGKLSFECQVNEVTALALIYKLYTSI